jgi:hypothetical protein
MGETLKTYVIYIHEDRYEMPNMEVAAAADDEAALELAADRLSASPHFHRVEVWDNNRFVGRLERDGG